MENREETKEELKNSAPSDDADSRDDDLDEELKKKKKARILIIIEIILLLLVIVLAVIFFSSRNKPDVKVSNYYGTNKISGNSNSNNQIINENEAPQIEIENSSPIENNNPASVGNEQSGMESQRLFLPVPNQSPVSSEEQIPAGAVHVLGMEEGFSPSEFKVKAGEEVTLALTSRIDYPVILTFYDETMPAISIGCGPRETRWVTFTAPQKSGRYIFKNDVFGKSAQVGAMIVE